MLRPLLCLISLFLKGDHVEKDDPVAEMESEKATFDLPAEESGTVKEIKVKENDEVKVGQVVIILDTEGRRRVKSRKKQKKS